MPTLTAAPYNITTPGSQCRISWTGMGPPGGGFSLHAVVLTSGILGADRLVATEISGDGYIDTSFVFPRMTYRFYVRDKNGTGGGALGQADVSNNAPWFDASQFSWENFKTFPGADPNFVAQVMGNPATMPPALKAALDWFWDYGSWGAGLRAAGQNTIADVRDKYGSAAAVAYWASWVGYADLRSDPVGWCQARGFVPPGGGTGGAVITQPYVPPAPTPPVVVAPTAPTVPTQGQIAATPNPVPAGATATSVTWSVS